ncbi:uncharacterized protein LOC131857363 [Cryptomeria japonica]|uniref:uncharacterized protein LOC131857363 n=1 Tax=Cryptomeria japonica TaxID=3369 RepID=UPI0027DA262A|nr:uncharacterized protein LOC131857363 [Cryptomeria japonica]
MESARRHTSLRLLQTKDPVRQVCYVMNLERNKLLRFVKDGKATMFVHEMQNGYEWARIAENQTSFDKAVKKLIKDLQDSRPPPFNRIEMCSQILARKKVVWMEGEQGWTMWLEDRDEILQY